MGKLIILLDKLLLVAKDVKIWLRILILVITLFAGAILFSRSKSEDCTVCEGERAQLLNVLIEVRSEVSKMQPTSYRGDESGYFSFASYHDTLPQQKKILKKIDSIIWKMRMDSIKRTKTKQ